MKKSKIKNVKLFTTKSYFSSNAFISIKRIELLTYRFSVCRSTTELYQLINYYLNTLFILNVFNFLLKKNLE